MVYSDVLQTPSVASSSSNALHCHAPSIELGGLDVHVELVSAETVGQGQIIESQSQPESSSLQFKEVPLGIIHRGEALEDVNSFFSRAQVCVVSDGSSILKLDTRKISISLLISNVE